MAGESVETALLIPRADRWAGQQKSILLATPFDHGEALAGYAGDRDGGVRHALAVEQCAEHLTGHAADREDCQRIAAEHVDSAGDIDAATARIVVRLAAAQLLGRHDKLGRCGDVSAGLGQNRRHTGVPTSVRPLCYLDYRRQRPDPDQAALSSIIENYSRARVEAALYAHVQDIARTVLSCGQGRINSGR
jgi:hypothetical protein